MAVSYIKEALNEAEKALREGEIPVGAVIVKDGEIIGRGHNMREGMKSSLCHAEIMAIDMASKNIGDWRLNGCTIYVTMEPCPMCAGAILQSRITEVNIGTFNETTGACGSVVNILQNPHLNSKIKVNWLYDDKCRDMIRSFFKKKRYKEKSDIL